MQDVRILHMANNVNGYANGMVNVAVDIAIEQAKRGHTVAFASAGGSYSELLESFGVRHLVAPQSGSRRALANSLGLLRLLRTYRPQVIHAHMRSGFALLLPWATLLRIPLVLHWHNVHDRSYGLPRFAARVLAVSTSVGDTLAKEGVSRSKIRVVLNGTLDSKRLPAAEDIENEAVHFEHPAVLTVAGMNTERKGIPELLDAFALLAGKDPAVQLYLVGGGCERKAFQAHASSMPAASRIHFLGPQRDPRPYLHTCDLFVLPSRRESFGLAVLEAREAGCAILASDVDGIPELLEFGRCGVLTPPQDVSKLAANMESMLSDAPLRSQLAEAAQTGLDRFTTARMTDDVMAAYDEVLR